jgi:hypothetical protein
MKADGLHNSDLKESHNQENDLEYFKKNDGERLSSFFQVFDSTCIDNEFEDGNQNNITNELEDKSWDYNPNNLFNHTIEDLEKILEELKRPLLDMVDGKKELNEKTFNKNTPLIKYLNWFLIQKDLHSYINKDACVENELKDEILSFSKELNLINTEISNLEYQISILTNQLSNAKNHKSNLEINNLATRSKCNLLHKYSSLDSNPLSVIHKCVFLNLIDSSAEEIIEFKLKSPVEIHDLLHEMITVLEALKPDDNINVV